MGVFVFLGLLLVRLIPGMSLLQYFLQNRFSRLVYHFFRSSQRACLSHFLSFSDARLDFDDKKGVGE
jgi:hypothetical protein